MPSPLRPAGTPKPLPHDSDPPRRGGQPLAAPASVIVNDFVKRLRLARPTEQDTSVSMTDADAATAATASPSSEAGKGEPSEDDEGTDASASGCFRLRQIRVDALLQDGTLGLLLHGTSIVGFCAPEAEKVGWAVGDQIVEVNGQRIALFDEFLEKFVAAQEQGFPIEFSVLRRECVEEQELSEDALDSFFSGTNFVDLAGQLQQKFGNFSPARDAQSNLGTPRSQDTQVQNESITENPYIQALRKRRDELRQTTEKWADGSYTLASRLATERYDALASLRPAWSRETPRRSGSGLGEQRTRSNGGWPSFLCTASDHSCMGREAGGLELLQTPRPERQELIGVDVTSTYHQVPVIGPSECDGESGGWREQTEESVSRGSFFGGASSNVSAGAGAAELLEAQRPSPACSLVDHPGLDMARTPVATSSTPTQSRNFAANFLPNR